MKKLYFLTLLLISSFSFGQILSDDFNYTDNALLIDNSWTAFSGAGTQSVDVGASNGLTYTGYSGVAGFTAAVVGNAARLDNTGEDVQKTFTPVTSGSIYYSFLINVDPTNAATGYSLGLTTTGSTFGNRFFVKPSSTAGKVNFGISNTSTANYAATDFDPNITYLIIIKYDATATGSYSMWIKTSGVPATEVAAGTADVSGSGSGSANIGGFFFRQHTASQNLTIDGLRIYSTWFNATPCDLSLDTATSTCNAVTLAIDTYDVTIPFTGGNTGSYALSASSGTISGDSPSANATGNIIISGIPEGTNVTLTVTGSCSLTRLVASPECKPINTLPYHEPFNYTVGQNLGSQQMWTNVNTGDDVSVKTGNLTYGSTTGTGNSIEFSGAGIDAFTPFTATTTGTVYAGFMMKVSDLTNVTDGNEDYFAILTDANKGFQARFFIKTVGTQYQLGFDSSGTTTTNYDATLRNVNDVVYVILGYDFATNMLKAWLNPNLTTFTATTTPSLTVDVTASPITELGGFMIRQGDNAKLPTIEVDELKISTVTTFLGSTAFNAIDGFKMYPNPSIGNTLYFTTVANAELDIQVYDMLGKQVINSKVSNNALNISGLNQGIYIVKVTEEGKTATRKLVVR